MPRKPRVPSYRLHRPSGQAVVTLGGHDTYLGPHGGPESHEAYRRCIAEWLASGRHEPVQADPEMSVSEVLSAYWAFAQSYYVKDGQQTSQVDRVKRGLDPVRSLYGSKPASTFGPKALKAVRAWMIARGWKRRVINQRIDCVRLCWRWAVAEELLPPSAAHALDALKRLAQGRSQAPESEEVPPAPEGAIAAVLPVLPVVLAGAVRFQLLTAARPGEALALEAERIDRSGDVWLYRPRSHKTQHRKGERLLLIGPQAQALILPWLDNGHSHVFSPRLSIEMFRAKQREARRSKVQPSQQDRSKPRPKRRPGERYRVSSYDRAIAKACRKVSCESWHPHQLRHNAATRLVAQFGWDVARIVLGHRTLDATRIYGADDLARAIDAIRQVG